MLGGSEISGHDIIHKVVEVGSINDTLPLVAWVHGCPAELIFYNFPLHEAPHRATHNGHRFLVGHDQDLSSLVHINPLAEKLT